MLFSYIRADKPSVEQKLGRLTICNEWDRVVLKQDLENQETLGTSYDNVTRRKQSSIKYSLSTVAKPPDCL